MKNNSLIRYVLIIGLIIGILTIISKIVDDKNGVSSERHAEKKMTIEEIENANPVQFLTADGKYNESFWGTELKINGNIINKATVAHYKDVVLRVTYYSKTNSVMANREYSIYEVFPPSRTKPFKLRVKNYKDVNSIGWEIVGAIPN